MPPVDPSKLNPPKKTADPRPGHTLVRRPPPAPALPLPNAAPPALVAGPNPVGLFKALRRRWLLALVAGLLLGGLAAVGTWYTPLISRPSAYVLLHVNAMPTKVVYAASEGLTNFEQYQKTQAVFAKGHSVVENALAQAQVASLDVVKEQADPAGWLEKEIGVDFTLGPEVMRLTLKGDRPEQLAIVLEAVAKAYLDKNAAREKHDRTVRLDQITAILAKEQGDLKNKQRMLKDLLGSDADGASTLTAQQKQAERTAANDKELLAVQSQLATTQTELETRQRKAGAPPGSPDPLVDDLVEDRLQKDTTLTAYFARQAVLNAEVKEFERIGADPDKQAAKQKRELANLQQVLDGRRQQLRDLVVKTEVAKLQDKIGLLKEQEKRLTEQGRKLAGEGNSGKKAGLDLDWLLKDVTAGEAAVKKLGDEAQALRYEMDAPPRVTAMQDAVVAPRDDRRQLQMAGMAGFGALALTVFGISWWEFWARRVNSLDDVAQGLGLRLLGALPKLPDHVRRKMVEPTTPRDFYWHNLLNESVDVTRTLLVHAAQADGLQVVMVTSALEGEGKTSLASHLAASLARAGRKTLLVDCDLRKPAAHKLFDLPLEPGLCELLRGEVHASDVIRPTRLSRLWMVPAGIWDGHATQALAQDGVQLIFEELRGQFDFVLIDSSPVLPVADALLVAQYADGVVFSILRDESRLPKVYAAYQRLALLGVRMLGAVVNGARGDSYGSEYQNVAAKG